MTMRPHKIAACSYLRANNKYIYPVVLSVADTMCHAPTGKSKLDDLGKVIHVEKLDIESIYGKSIKTNMRYLLNTDPELFAEYASRDSIVTLLYISALYGYNQHPPVTMISAGAYTIKQIIMEYLGCSDDKEFNRIYRGLEKVKHGKEPRDDGPGFIEASSLSPISDQVNTVQYFAKIV